MRAVAVLGLSCVLAFTLSLASCSFLDGMLGVGPDTKGDGKPDSTNPSGGIVGTVGRTVSGLPGILGLIGTLLGGAATTYQYFRVKKYRNAASSFIRGVDTALNYGKKDAVTKNELYSGLEDAAESSGHEDFVEKLVEEVKREFRKDVESNK